MRYLFLYCTVELSATEMVSPYGTFGNIKHINNIPVLIPNVSDFTIAEADWLSKHIKQEDGLFIHQVIDVPDGFPICLTVGPGKRDYLQWLTLLPEDARLRIQDLIDDNIARCSRAEFDQQKSRVERRGND